MGSEKRRGYRDIKQIIIARLRDKTWPPGSILPKEQDLAREFGCSRSTVNRAMQELADEGLLERRRKAGTRVTDIPVRQARFLIPLVRTEIEATGKAYRYLLAERSVLPVPVQMSARLGLGVGDPVLHVKCMHYAAGAPYQFEDRWINLTTVPAAEAESFEEISPNEWLIGEVPITRGRMAFMAARAEGALALSLEVQEGAPIFVTERTTWLGNAVVTFARMTFPGDYRMETDF